MTDSERELLHIQVKCLKWRIGCLESGAEREAALESLVDLLSRLAYEIVGE